MSNNNSGGGFRRKFVGQIGSAGKGASDFVSGCSEGLLTFVVIAIVLFIGAAILIPIVNYAIMPRINIISNNYLGYAWSRRDSERLMESLYGDKDRIWLGECRLSKVTTEVGESPTSYLLIEYDEENIAWGCTAEAVVYVAGGERERIEGELGALFGVIQVGMAKRATRVEINDLLIPDYQQAATHGIQVIKEGGIFRPTPIPLTPWITVGGAFLILGVAIVFLLIGLIKKARAEKE